MTFEGVSFAYTGEEATQDKLANVLHDVSFSLPAGAVLGLLGRTGSGKSTLARLLVRFYDPTSGAIRLGPRGTSDIRGFALADLRSRVGMVTQNIQLFRATVRDNLTFFDPAIPDEHIRRAVEELGLEEWLAALPDGLESVLEAGGAGLSAGQAQLLAFTRVFLRDPGLLILDEASSRLDAATERTIERAVDRLLGGGRRTAIVIAHRLATVGRADRIMVLSEGRILEEGKRADLAADGRSHFHRLLRRGLEEVLA